jgi:DNA repair exonuclease SbcCD nuclease subunit
MEERAVDNNEKVLILSGDLHLGRASSRVPGRIHGDELRATGAWGRIVELAIREQAAAVCLSGDVVDQDNRFWEAIGPLERGIRRLSSAGVRTLAVAGNHDHEVLARLAEQFAPDTFHLLGKNGNWERLSLKQDGRTILHVDGWSFPKSRVPTSPLDSYDLPRDPDTPTLGLVHGDLDSSASPYAPLGQAILRALGPSAWLLGHVHAPRLIAEPGRPWILYPGSPQALDPGETGVHGPWLCRVSSGGLESPVQVPASSVGYVGVGVDLEGVDNEAELQVRVLDQIREEVARTARLFGDDLSCLSLRLRLTGRTRLSGSLPEIVPRIKEDLALTVEGVTVDVERVDVETLPAIDLAEYARSSSAPGAVSRLIIELEGEGLSEETRELVRRVRRGIEEQDLQRAFAGLDRFPISDALARNYLLTQARSLLTRLVEQSE